MGPDHEKKIIITVIVSHVEVKPRVAAQHIPQTRPVPCSTQPSQLLANSQASPEPLVSKSLHFQTSQFLIRAFHFVASSSNFRTPLFKRKRRVAFGQNCSQICQLSFEDLQMILDFFLLTKIFPQKCGLNTKLNTRSTQFFSLLFIVLTENTFSFLICKKSAFCQLLLRTSRRREGQSLALFLWAFPILYSQSLSLKPV